MVFCVTKFYKITSMYTNLKAVPALSNVRNTCHGVCLILRGLRVARLIFAISPTTTETCNCVLCNLTGLQLSVLLGDYPRDDDHGHIG
jgi:hypothetical protein